MYVCMCLCVQVLLNIVYMQLRLSNFMLLRVNSCADESLQCVYRAGVIPESGRNSIFMNGSVYTSVCASVQCEMHVNEQWFASM